MYQVSDDDIQDLGELHIALESFIESIKDKYSDEIILAAVNIVMIDLIRGAATDKKHFLSCKQRFCTLVDMDAERFYG